MKKTASLLILIVSTVTIAFAQSTKTEANTQTGDLNCFQKYEKAFKERGAKPVDDGDHTNVIITIRKGDDCECLSGKVTVEYGAVIKTYVKMEDGQYEELNKKFKTGIGDIFVYNGISKTRTTLDNELVNVIFVDKINPKKANYVKAPDPPADF
jgi:hypothetical protein